MVNSSEIPRTYAFKGLYVIGSSIQDFQKNSKPKYVKEGKLLNEKKVKEYSSEDALITKEEVSEIFKRLGLI